MPGFRVRRPAADVRAATVAALERGGAFVPHPFLPDARQHVYEDIRGWCESPLLLRQEGEGHMQLGHGQGHGEGVYQPARSLHQLVQCRKCAGCRRWKRAMWSNRAALEWAQSHRTWLGTLTIRPEERYRIDTAIRLRLAADGVKFDALSTVEIFRERLKALNPLVDLFLARLRKGRAGQEGMAIRYLVAVEPHKDGFPHVHILLHEQREHAGVGRRQLEAEWRDAQSGRSMGHAAFKLVRDPGGARYAAKYLGKYETDRVRASLHYGQRENVPVLMMGGAGAGMPMPLASFLGDPEDSRTELVHEVPASVRDGPPPR